jgi:hypothetical protein
MAMENSGPPFRVLKGATGYGKKLRVLMMESDPPRVLKMLRSGLVGNAKGELSPETLRPHGFRQTRPPGPGHSHAKY